MNLDFSCRETRQVEKYLRRIAVAKEVINVLPKLAHTEENLRRKSLLKSAVFSARIEGNKLTLSAIRFSQGKKEPQDTAKREIFNILSTLHWLDSKSGPKALSKNLILTVHKKIMNGLVAEAGYLRKEASAIFNQAGVAIYLPAPPNEVPILIKKIIDKTNRSKEAPPVKAALFHFAFEKIHPFLDGNGRVGRILSSFILKRGGYGFRGLVSFEEFIEENRQTYYDLLSLNKKDITPFIVFFLESLAIQAERAIKDLTNKKEEQPEDSLLPRRREILEIIQDHKMVSFDFIKRRFLKIPDSTLHYDLKRLLEKGFVRKIGSTRGVLYQAKR